MIGVVTGLAGAVFCATRPRSLATRFVEMLGVLFYSLPAYLFGFGILLLFEPSFGLLPLPYFFHPLDYEAPLEDPWVFVRAMLVPWIVVAAPLAAVVMRLTQAAMLEQLDSRLRAHGRGEGTEPAARDPPPRGAPGLRLGGVADRRLGARRS